MESVPAGVPSPVQRRERVLVQLVTLLTPGSAREQVLYRPIEWGAERMVRRHLRQVYRTRLLLRGPHATMDGLVAALSAASAHPQVRAVDLVVNPHGTSRRLWFVDGPVDADEVAVAVVRALTTHQRRRLRAVFSTACYGMWHTDAWMRAGFCVAVGSRQIYADGVTSLPRMLRGWAAGSTVRDAVGDANAGWARRRQDALAARYYRTIGRAADAGAVDSERVVDGARTMVITSDPAQWRPPALPA